MVHNSFIFGWMLATLAAVAAAQGQAFAPGQRSPEVSRQMLLQAAHNLYSQKALESEFRFRIDAYKRTLVGSGSYRQAGEGPEKQFRLEMAAQLEDHKATQQMICGRQYLWIRRDLGNNQPSLARVDLRRVRMAINDAGPPLSVDPSPTWLGLVSLPKLLMALANWFEFEPAEQARLGERNVLEIRGVINAKLRENLLTKGAKAGQGREQIPDAVKITLGTDDALPLFPYRIEYLQRSRDEQDTASATMKPLLTLDFSSVKVPSTIDLKQFDYSPEDQEVEDRTRLYLERLGFTVKDDR